MNCLRKLLISCLLFSSAPALAEISSPKIVRVYPLGGQLGTAVQVEILGEYLANSTTVEFDCHELHWTKTLSASSAKLLGLVSISPEAALGSHLLRVVTLDGVSTSAIFNVAQFPSRLESEPNNLSSQAQAIEALPVEIQGRLDGAVDIDVYAVRVRAGERWTFDFRSIEYGSAAEAKMLLLDAAEKRVAFSDDRNDYDETPLIDHTFTSDGTYFIKLDQYRGPRGFNFGKNCAYILRISALPQIQFASPLGFRTGGTVRIKLRGIGLERLEKVHLTELRQAEYARMTYPYTVPIHFRPDPPTASRVDPLHGKVLQREAALAEVTFDVPPGAKTGLWRLRGVSAGGTSDGVTVEISDVEEHDELQATSVDWRTGELAINGEISHPGEEDVYRFDAIAGKPLHFWTLAAQLGGPQLDTVLVLRDAAGKILVEEDDIVAGQGTLIGNPDSSLYFTPEQDAPVFLTVRDRLRRGGPNYSYRLKVRSERPSFQLFTTPENFTVARGDASEIKVHLIRERGFAGEVTVWFEQVPPGIEAPRGKFRADQLFEPNADGADMIIPELIFRIQAPETLPLGNYPLRILGVATAEEKSEARRVVQAQTTLLQGPLLDLWNFIRRPLPHVSMTVCDPPPARIESLSGSLSLKRGESATLELKVERLDESASIQLKELPTGVNGRLNGRQADQVTFVLEALPEAALGSFEISAETTLKNRRITTQPISLLILPAPKSYSPSAK
jgi:hypothetical protein